MESNRIVDLTTELKNEIVSMINIFLGERDYWAFNKVLNIRYCVCGYMVDRKCSAIVYNGCLCASVTTEIGTERIDLLCLDVESLTNVLFRLEEEIRGMYALEIKSLLSKCGGRFTLTEDFLFDGYDEIEKDNVKLLQVFLDNSGKDVMFYCRHNYSDLKLGIDFPNINELESILDYLKLNVKRTFKVKATLNVEKVYEVEASSPSEAIKKAEVERMLLIPIKKSAVDSVNANYEIIG